MRRHQAVLCQIPLESWDYETARFTKLLGTLPAHVDTTGLRITEPDLLLILLRSLPEPVKSFCLHHSTGDTYEAYRNSARRWEEQQRMFGEILDSFHRPTERQLQTWNNSLVKQQAARQRCMT